MVTILLSFFIMKVCDSIEFVVSLVCLTFPPPVSIRVRLF